MIVVSFFSAKGGTGKTTFNMSMASFLKYHLGKAVIMLDADTPEYNLYNSRVRELDYKRANGGIDESALYPVWKVLDVTPEGIENLAGKLDALRGSVDYVLIDFPGSCVKDDAIWTFARRGVLDLVVIPVDMDPMVLASALQLAEIFTHTGQKGQDSLREIRCRGGTLPFTRIPDVGVPHQKRSGDEPRRGEREQLPSQHNLFPGKDRAGSEPATDRPVQRGDWI